MGHVVASCCGWHTYQENQFYWNEFRMISAGGLEPNEEGYDYSQMVEIYSSANATTSDVVVWWWSPGIFNMGKSTASSTSSSTVRFHILLLISIRNLPKAEKLAEV